MIFSLKSLSRSVHEEEQTDIKPEIIKTEDVHDDHGCCRTLTVWRKSLLISCNGFTVFDSSGDLVYRVDNYIGHPEELILMDGSGKSVLTMHRRKRLGIVDNWLVYGGEAMTEQCCARTQHELSKKPIWCVRKQYTNIFQGNQHVLAYVFRGESGHRRCAYVVEGSYAQRSCKVFDETRRVVAEIKRKEATNGGVSFGVEVFVLSVQPGFHPGFAMALVLLLDQMFS